MASGASKLENELVAFIEDHPETFSPQDIVNLRRKHCGIVEKSCVVFV